MCALGMHGGMPSVKTCLICLQRGENTKTPAIQPNTPSLPYSLSRVFAASSDIDTPPWLSDLRDLYLTDLAAAGGASCKGCKLGAIKNKFVKLIAAKLKETDAKP